MQPATGFVGQVEVLHALILREMKTRFGEHQLGYLWALIEPVLWVGTFLGMFYVVGRTAPNGMDTPAFIYTGLLPFIFFRETCARTVAAVSANKGLLFYPQIQPLDLSIARAMLEGATMAVVFAVLETANAAWKGEVPRVDDWLVFVLSFGAAGLFGACLGLVIAALAVFTPAVERLHGVILRPLFWVSGIFFTANGLPSSVRHYFMFNPLLHVIEFVRTGWFQEYTTEHASPRYVVFWIVSLAFLGLVLERVARRRLELT